jgi:hypothetical protein
VAVVPAERSGMASGSSSTFRQVGIATGIAGLGAVFLREIRPNTVNALNQSAAGRAILARGGSHLAAAIAGGDVRAAATGYPAGLTRNTLIEAYRVGFTSTFNHLMEIALGIALVGAIGSFFLVRQRDFVSSSPLTGPDGGDEAGGGGGAPPVRRPPGHSKRRRGRHSAEHPSRRPVRATQTSPEPTTTPAPAPLPAPLPATLPSPRPLPLPEHPSLAPPGEPGPWPGPTP